MKQVTLTVNGETVSGAVEPRTHLADFIRGQVGLTGTHLGCEQGVCGACTVYIEGRPQRACLAYAVACDGARVETVEGFADDPVMEALRDAFSEHHALQCGFCTPGMLVSARDIVARLDAPDERRIRHELSGNLCRCTGYQGIVGAIASVIRTTKGAPDAPDAQDRPAAHAGPARPTACATPRTAPPTFQRRNRLEPAAEAPATAGASASAPTMRVDAEGWTVLEQSIAVGHDAETVWRAFADVAQLARCMPGAEVSSVKGEVIEGRLRIRFGPIAASFAGQAERSLDPEARVGRLVGAGADSGSGTRAQGAVTYRVASAPEGGARVEVEVRFKLAGALAQFSRSGLVKDFANRLTEQFTANLARLLAGERFDAAAAGGGDLNAVGLVLSILWRRLKRLFGGG
ncbi:hypothetical protein AY600_07380 [Phormidium willei BDU 130791]|nr:hypothetical protein AY600_07380 [Phormidium willei BDU 130791]